MLRVTVLFAVRLRRVFVPQSSDNRQENSDTARFTLQRLDSILHISFQKPSVPKKVAYRTFPHKLCPLPAFKKAVDWCEARD